jgi:bifunctional non-homologous end joining protein LigD
MEKRKSVEGYQGMSLREYNRKRDFEKTCEPAGDSADKTGGHRFVIQKHAASHLHYDFRLEMGGTLKSWAVPKGVPYIKGEKRLAMEVEDHPVSYINFEGTIPKGQYGGGTVMVWDRGTYEPLSSAPEKELAGGKLHFVLRGKKLKGEWYLVRIRGDNQWLLIKGGEDHVRTSAKLEDTSAISGKSMEQISGSKKVWQSNREETDPVLKKNGPPKTSSEPSAKKTTAVKASTKPNSSKKKPSPNLVFVEPMKARLVENPPPGDWIYEIKFDGYRALAFKQGEAVQLLSRNEKSFNEKFPQLVNSVAEIQADDAIIDGEIVALNPDGRSSFQLLQAYELAEKHPPLFYYVFDLLRLDGKDLTRRPVGERKALLEKLIKKSGGLTRFSASMQGDVQDLLKQAQRLGLEGLIGKMAGSTYEPGARSGAWVKLKLSQEQEMVVGGFTPPGGSRQHFGALLLGYHENKKLIFAGKVGTGFNDKLLRELHQRFEKISAQTCPFSNLPEKRTARYGQSLTPGEMKKCRWLKPKLVCQIKFAEWTQDGKLRQPVFMGIREDKSASEVIRERPSDL